MRECPLEISKELCSDHQMIKKVVENLTKLGTRSKGKGFKNLLPQVECKVNRVIEQQSFLTSAQIFKKTKIKGVKKVRITF